MWIFWTLVCLSVAFVLWALWYVNDRGFTRKWRRMVEKELAQQGIHADIRRLTLNPLRGLVARDVRLFDGQERQATLASVSEAVLDIDYAKLFNGEAFVNALDLRHAALSLPLERKGEPLEIRGLNARILLPPGQLTIAQAEAVVHGVRVSVTGHLLNPKELPALSGTGGGGGGERARKAIAWLRQMELGAGSPSLTLRFEGDLAAPDRLFAEAVFQSGALDSRGVPLLRAAQVVATYREGTLRLRQCAIAGVRGKLDAAGTWSPAKSEGVFQLRSTLDLPFLAKRLELGERWNNATFEHPPVLELRGEVEKAADATPRVKMQGRFEAGAFRLHEVAFEGAAADFSWDGERWFLRNARVDHASGRLAGDALQTAEGLRFRVRSGVNPSAFAPFLSDQGEEILSEWEFLQPPQVSLEGHAPASGWQGLVLQGHAALGKTRLRGVPMEALEAPIDYRDRILTIKDFRIIRTEGRGSGTFVLDLPDSVVRIVNGRSTMTPVDVGIWIDRRGELPRNLAPYRFSTPPDLTVEGTVELGRRDDKTRLRIGVDGKGLEYVFLGETLPVPRVFATLWIEKDRLRIEDLRGTLFGGKIRGDADISLEAKKGDYTVDAAVEEVDFPALTKLYFNYDTSKGKLRGEGRFSGRGPVARNVVGSGRLLVTDGNVFAIPILGPFSGILNEVLPGTGYNQARKATATFEMKEGTIHTGDLLVEGKGFSMMGGGTLFFLEDKMDFSIRINAQGAAGMILTPVSHLFEYTSDGPLSNPVWRPRRLPKKLFGR